MCVGLASKAERKMLHPAKSPHHDIRSLAAAAAHHLPNDAHMRFLCLQETPEEEAHLIGCNLAQS
jgi:hypothetical protein